MHDRGIVDRLRSYGRALVIAAGVSFGQLGDSPRGSSRSPHAIVHMLPELPTGFDRMEVVGRDILTRQLRIGPSGDRDDSGIGESPN